MLSIVPAEIDEALCQGVIQPGQHKSSKFRGQCAGANKDAFDPALEASQR